MSTDAKLDAFELLMLEMSAAMADIVENLQQGRSSNDEISTTLVDMLELMAKRHEGPNPIEGLTAAIQALRLDVAPAQVTVQNTVQVMPTPIENIVHVAPAAIQVIERALPVDYELLCTYDSHNRITRAVIARLPNRKP